MKIFESSNDYSEKINFVDKNNVFVGYDMGQDCCEQASWFISDSIKTLIPNNSELENKDGLTGYNFDPEYFKIIEDLANLESGGMAIFRLVRGKKQKFLHLFNCHNGYYSHGFEMKIGEDIKQIGSL